MDALSVNSNEMAGSSVAQRLMIHKVLLIGGIVSSLVYVAINIFGAMQFEGYSSFSQTVSELIAIGAPSRSLVVQLMLVYGILICAFGVGIWMSAGRKRALCIAAILIVAKEVLGAVVTLFFPIHLRGVAGMMTDTMHGILTSVGVFLFMFPAMGLGASAFGKRFRFYSIATMLIFIICGVLTFLDASALGANLPTLWMGVWERINIFGYLLWCDVLSINLIRALPNNLRLADRKKSLPAEKVTK